MFEELNESTLPVIASQFGIGPSGFVGEGVDLEFEWAQTDDPIKQLIVARDGLLSLDAVPVAKGLTATAVSNVLWMLNRSEICRGVILIAATLLCVPMMRIRKLPGNARLGLNYDWEAHVRRKLGIE